jgi:hypothetical protein
MKTLFLKEFYKRKTTTTKTGHKLEAVLKERMLLSPTPLGSTPFFFQEG